MTEEIEILFDIAVLGEQVDQFFKSDIGKYLLDHAAAQEAQGLERLKKVKCSDAQAVWEAQSQVWVAEQFRTWLTDAIQAGLKAQMILEDREE
jgi:cytochrome c-type biogenesis protein CcmH/NrfF